MNTITVSIRTADYSHSVSLYDRYCDTTAIADLATSLPVSKQCISVKVIPERVVISRAHNSEDYGCKYESTRGKMHTTETAILRKDPDLASFSSAPFVDPSSTYQGILSDV
jgi:hypothetical protein